MPSRRVLPEIEEVAEPCLFGGDKKQVVIVLAKEIIGAPVKREIFVTPDAHFHGPGDHLFERRIADQSIGQIPRARLDRSNQAQWK